MKYHRRVELNTAPVRRSGSGQATSAGTSYQDRVAAWLAVRVLAESAASPLWHLSADVSFEFVRCETEQAVDDIMVGTSADGFIFIQAKHTVTLSPRSTSDLAKALQQYVQRHLAFRGSSQGLRRWERPLDPATDRLVLVVGPHSSASIREDLPAILRRARRLVRGQPISDSAQNANESRVFDVIEAHVSRLWRDLTGHAPSADEFLDLLQLLEVTTLSVDEDGSDELTAKDMLRREILAEPADADNAWNNLIQGGTTMAVGRSGLDRRILQVRLGDAGISVLAARSYRNDIRELRDWTRRTALRLERFASTPVGNAIVKIDRPCTAALRQMAAEGSLVVVGQPGAGKTAALHDLARMLLDEERDIFFMAADDIAAMSVNALSQELGLGHPITEVLENWPGSQPGYVLLDALDAARPVSSGKALRALIALIVGLAGRWRVVVSIRKYDLRYDQELRALFHGTPAPHHHDPEFAQLRHLCVTLLEDDEFAQVFRQSPAMGALIARSSQRLKELLRVPFNLRIAAELLSGGAQIDELVPIKTQVDLLNQYWRQRVLEADDQRDAREHVLQRVASRMVERRALQVERRSVAEPATGAALLDLLRKQVLIEWQRAPGVVDEDVLAFGHHVLFDYAVSRLLLGREPSDVAAWLVREPDLVLAIRPSLVFHLQRLWFGDDRRAEFWDAVLVMARERNLPRIGKLVGPTVAAELGGVAQDLERLLAEIESGIRDRVETASEALRDLVGALVTWGGAGGRALAGEDAVPWAEVAERASRVRDTSVQYTLRVLLLTVCEKPQLLTPEQMHAYGLVARRLFEFAWDRSPRDGGLILSAIQGVCRTFASDPTASAILLSRCLNRDHVPEHGYEELPQLAMEVDRLIPLDADLVEALYTVAFTYTELSKTDTPMGGSRIIRMISNRAQDYNLARYTLAGSFGTFLRQAPLHATRALISALETYVEERETWIKDTRADGRFAFGVLTAEVCADASSIWSLSDLHTRDDALRMLNDFRFHLNDLAGDGGDIALLEAIVDVTARRNRCAVVWTALLNAGAAHPASIGQLILPLAWAKPILEGFDTTVAAGRFLVAIFPGLGVDARKRIERTICNVGKNEIAGESPEDDESDAHDTRDRLLGCLSAAHLVTKRARELRKRLDAAGSIPPNQPLVRFWSESRTLSQEDLLREAGVVVEDPANERVATLIQPVKDFTANCQNQPPTSNSAEALWPALVALRQALVLADVDGVHPVQRDLAWGYLAEAAQCVSRQPSFPCREQLGGWIRTVLLEAAKYPIPEHHPEYDEQFDRHQSWSSPSARIEAAAGLMNLARYPDCVDGVILEAVQLLSADPVPAVRYQIAVRLGSLMATAHGFVWQCVEDFVRLDPSRGVLRGLVHFSLRSLWPGHPERVATVLQTIFDTAGDGDGAIELRTDVLDILVDMYLWKSHSGAKSKIVSIINDMGVFHAELRRMAGHLRRYLAHGPIDLPEQNADEVRRRAVEIAATATAIVVATTARLEECYTGQPFDAWTAEDQQLARAAAELADGIAMELYFASGAYAEQHEKQSTEPPKSDREIRRFLDECGDLIDQLATIHIPSIAHYLLQTLEFLAPADPEHVFLKVARVVQEGQHGGYQYEPLAAELIVKIVERYLAQYRHVFRDSQDCLQALIATLDIFVMVGWPSAQRLVYRLEELYR